MVEFGSGYLMPMDREYGHHAHAHDHSHDHASPSRNSTNDVGVGIKDLGMSLAVGPVPHVPAIGAKLRSGMKTLEIGFMGSGKGTGQSQTPEYYGKAQRQALVEIGTANEVSFTTHASFGVQGLAGADQRGNFSKAQKEMALQEIRRAIEFAGDVAKGGPVVVHTGEFHRPITGAEWNQQGEYAGRFRMFEKELEQETFGVVDRRLGNVLIEAHKNKKVSKPVWLTAKTGQEFEDIGGKKKTAREGEIVYIDYLGKQVQRNQRVPVFDKDNAEFVIKQYDWKELGDQAKEMEVEAREEWRRWKQASSEEKEKIKEKSMWLRFLRDDITDPKEIKIRTEEAYVIASLETNAGNARGWAYNYSRDFDEHVETTKKLRKALEYYEKLEKATDPEEKWRLQRQVGDSLGGLIPPDTKSPTEIIKRQLATVESHIKQAQESAASQFAQAHEQMETIKYIQSAETYALEQAYDSYAQAGISAMRQSDKIQRKGDLRKPIAVAMENLFPESYGAHPDELMSLVLKSREKMELILQEKYKMSKEEAKKRALNHITATIDLGHVNMWRKYWSGDSKKTIEQNDKEFDEWVVKKMAEMAKKNVVGHVHLDDNFGYHDDHLAPGEGNAPIVAMVKALKDNGYKGELIVEPGADWTTDLSGFHSVMKTWRLFDSPVYGAGSAMRGRGWSDAGGYVGMAQPAYFIFGAYSPSEDWTLWSGVPLE